MHVYRFMYKDTVDLKSVLTALETLGLANKYMCVGLVDECIIYLTRNLTVDTALMVYRAARLYSGHASRARDRPSPSSPSSPATVARATAPPLQDLMPPAAAADDDAHTEAFARILRHFDALLAYCCAFVDRNADRVMMDESVDDLDTAELRELLRRDTLAVSSEMVCSLLLGHFFFFLVLPY